MLKHRLQGGRRAHLVVALSTVSFVLACGATTAATAALPPSTNTHVPTWAYDDHCTSGGRASGPLVRAWVTYAESNCGPVASKARKNCHIHGRTYCAVIQYFDTDWSFRAQAPTVDRRAGSDWWVHQPAPRQHQRIFTTTFTGGYATNQANPLVRAYYRRYALKHFNPDDGLMMDWQAASTRQQWYFATCGCESSFEIRTNAALRKAHTEMAADITHDNRAKFMQIDNSLPWNPYSAQGMQMLNPHVGVVGWSEEGAPEDFGTLDPFYSTLLDQIAYIAHDTRGFLAMWPKGYAHAKTLYRSRLVTEATDLLGFTPTHLVDWADLERGSHDLAVWPEEGIYPTDPVQTMAAPRGRGCLAGTGKVCSSGGHKSLEVAGGVYRREFHDCADRGHFFGACGAIVNTTGHSVRVKSSWLRLSYGHEITLTGGDVQVHGRIDLTGARFSAGKSTVPPDSALLLAP